MNPSKSNVAQGTQETMYAHNLLLLQTFVLPCNMCKLVASSASRRGGPRRTDLSSHYLKLQVPQQRQTEALHAKEVNTQQEFGLRLLQKDGQASILDITKQSSPLAVTHDRQQMLNQSNVSYILSDCVNRMTADGLYCAKLACWAPRHQGII